jgi:hypothetical protein
LFCKFAILFSSRFFRCVARASCRRSTPACGNPKFRLGVLLLLWMKTIFGPICTYVIISHIGTCGPKIINHIST